MSRPILQLCAHLFLFPFCIGLRISLWEGCTIGIPFHSQHVKKVDIKAAGLNLGQAGQTQDRWAKTMKGRLNPWQMG